MMKNPEKLIDTIKAVKIPEKYELYAWELEAIWNAGKLDVFRMISWAFKCGYMRGLKAGETSK